MLKNIIKSSIVTIVFLNVNTDIYSQTAPVALEEAIRLMTSTYEYQKNQKDSIVYIYKHRSFKATILPKIILSGAFPNYSRSISLVTQPEGYDKYVTRSYATSNFGFNISQLLPFTGGTVTFSSNLERQDNFNALSNRYGYYLNLFNISYSQSLFSYNAYKWQRKTEKLTESIEQINYHQRNEAVKQKIIELFFNLLIAQREYELNKENFELYKYVYDNAQKLYEVRRISKEDMLAAKIEFIKAKDAVNDITLIAARNDLKAYLKWNGTLLPEAVFNDSIIPTQHLNINTQEIIEKAIKYNYTLTKDLNVLNKRIEQKQIKKSVSPTVSLSIGSGYNSQFQSFSNILDEKASRLSASISVTVPIYDGGIGKYKKAIVNIELAQLNDQYENNITHAAIEYEKELHTINLLISSIKNNKEALNLISQRINIMKLNVEKGKIDIQQMMQIKVQQLKTFITYNTQIQQLYLLIYKYRYLSLVDVRNNKKLLFE